ncbi:MarR family winged helix-turn-helix transcriptional regulator [Specibacter cremeus]|uniref:MarR family winged helix-turn-helix transcriptional regulator n=1 Tax=Specibacter cremeus TaxID=1629051 RepID=UPI001F0BCEAB|nr:MarR family transcriptional regulator [Specibacter cremeus]
MATDAWESLFRAQVAVARQLHKEPALRRIGEREYDVLYNLSRCPSGWLRMNELNEHVLLSQPSISRMVERLESRGLVRRKTADGDKRGVLIGLTEAGAALQRDVGRTHVVNIMQLMEDALDDDELATLLALTTKLRESATMKADMGAAAVR